MKSRESNVPPKSKSKSKITYSDSVKSTGSSVESNKSRTSSKTSSDGKVSKSPILKKLIDSVTSDVEKAPMTEQTYPSFVSGISDCSSCDQQTKAVNLKSVDEDCENILQQFTNAFAQIGRSPVKTNDARQIGVQCLDYVNDVLFDIERLERERMQEADHREELHKNLLQTRLDKGELEEEIRSVHQINTILTHENRQILGDFYAHEDHLNVIHEENNSYRSVLERQKSAIKAELKNLLDSSMQVERAVVDKEIRWDNLNYHLQKRVAELQRDHDQLKVNYDLMCNALRVGNRGDVDSELMDVGVLEAGHEAEMVMMKYAHESFISELNKLNCKLWNEKFYTRGRLEEEMKKCDLYTSWLMALEQENAKYRDEVSSLNGEVEGLLDVICSKLENVATG